MQTLRVTACSGIPQSSKRGGHEWPPKAARNPKLGAMFLHNAHPCLPLAQPLMGELKVVCLAVECTTLLHSAWHGAL